MKDNISELKRQAAAAAVDEIQNGMAVGLGSGSTSALMVAELGQRLYRGQLRDIICIATSEAIAEQARSLGIPLTSLSDRPVLDLTIDGADEIDPGLNLIKGLGGSLLREKIIAASSQAFIIISDDRKLVDQLGTRSPLPVEVIPMAERPVTDFLKSLGARPVVRKQDRQTYITDEGNIILDCYFDQISDPHHLSTEIISRPGVVEHGLFLEMATQAIVAASEGVRHITAKD